jgi:hypothetical protein
MQDLLKCAHCYRRYADMIGRWAHCIDRRWTLLCRMPMALPSDTGTVMAAPNHVGILPSSANSLAAATPHERQQLGRRRETATHPPGVVRRGRHRQRGHEVEGERRPEAAAQRRVGQQAVGGRVPRHQQVEAELAHPAPPPNRHATAVRLSSCRYQESGACDSLQHSVFLTSTQLD